MEGSITIRCRRCLTAILDCFPGSLIGCLTCRLFTRATLTHTLGQGSGPRNAPVKVSIATANGMGYHVRIRAAKEQFPGALDSFQQSIPKAQRMYNPTGKYWFVDLRGLKRLRGWAEQMEQEGARVSWYDLEEIKRRDDAA